ncbi:MAG: CD1375 family protein [Muricoprocola sp.]
MAAVYANLIIKGKKTIDEVPEKIRDEVKVILNEKGFPGLTEGGN